MLRSFLCLALVTLAWSAEWMVGWKSAVAASTKTGKPILANFTGSDWCGWCIQLKKEVFDTPEFAAWAAKNVILLEVDFPQRTQQPAGVAKENQALANTYKIEGFPTILMLKADGTALGNLGYQKGGPAVWIPLAQKLIPPGK
jgi:protein disulfide-isomerase